MMKIFGIVMIVISCSGGGYYFSLKYKNRIASLNFLLKLVNHYKNQIRWKRSSIGEVLDSALEDESMGNRDYLSAVKELYSQSADLSKAMIEPLAQFNEINLKPAELALLKDFSASAGKNDISGELELCEQTIDLLQDYKRQATEEYKRNGALVVKLGIICGVWLGILLI